MSTYTLADAQDWGGISGGCEKPCRGTFPDCGHQCPYNCHPFSHHEILCQEKCAHRLPCGHSCDKMCGELCHCAKCNIKYRFHPRGGPSITNVKPPASVSKAPDSGSDSKGSDQKTWAQHAGGGVAHHDAELRTKLQKLNLAAEARGVNYELRDKYLLEQERAPGTSANSDLQAARTAAIAQQAVPPMPQVADQPSAPNSGNASSDEQNRYAWKSNFNMHDGARPFPGFEQPIPASAHAVNPTPPSATAVVASNTDLLINFD